MTHDVLGSRLHRDIHTMLERLEEQRCGPGVVHHHIGAHSMGLRGNGWNVLHLEGARAWSLHKHNPRVLSHLRGNARTDTGIVELGLNSKTCQHAFAEGTGRAVHAVGQQYMISCTDQCQNGMRAGGQTGGQNDGAKAAFSFCHRFFQCARCRRSKAPIGGIGVVRPLATLPLLKACRDDGGASVDRRIHHPMVKLWPARGMRQESGGLVCSGHVRGHQLSLVMPSSLGTSR